MTTVLSLLLMIMTMPAPALASSGSKPPNPITSSGTYYLLDYMSVDTLTINPGLTVQLDGNMDLIDKPQIVCGAGVALTLNKVYLATRTLGCALTFQGSGNSLFFLGDNSLLSGSDHPGICVETGTELEIRGDDAASLISTGGQNGAGIGGASYTIGGKDSGVIKILSGFVSATGGEKAAGIGGGNDLSNGTLLISGGLVVATAGNYASGIGGKNGGNITITGGEVYATSERLSAAIGGGEDGSAGTITITGGTVDARAIDPDGISSNGAGIGCGHNGKHGGTVTITGGTVYAESGQCGAGIGGAFAAKIDSIKISGGNVTARSSIGGAGIGGGSIASGGTISITGGIITATGGSADSAGAFFAAAGIGGGGAIFLEGISMPGGAAGTINISGGKVYAKMGTRASEMGSKDSGKGYDMGPGKDASGGKITLSGTASIFLENDKIYQPTILDPLEHVTPLDLSRGTIRGIKVEKEWLNSTGAFLKKITVPVNVPHTGEDITYLYWFAGLAVVALAGILILLRSRHKIHIH